MEKIEKYILINLIIIFIYFESISMFSNFLKLFRIQFDKWGDNLLTTLGQCTVYLLQLSNTHVLQLHRTWLCIITCEIYDLMHYICQARVTNSKLASFHHVRKCLTQYIYWTSLSMSNFKGVGAMITPKHCHAKLLFGIQSQSWKLEQVAKIFRCESWCFI